MALQRTQIPVPLTAGLESREDPKLVPNPALLVRENALFKGESAFTPRHGYKALADVSNLGAAIELGLGKAGALATFRDELLLAAAGNVFSYEASRNDWSNKGRLRAWSVHSEQVYADSYEQSFGDCATNSGVTVYAYESTQGGLYATVVDETSGTRIVSSKLISATGSKPKVLAVGPWLYILFTYTTGPSKYVYFSRLNVAAPSTISAAAVLLIDGLVSGTPYWGAVTIGQNFAVVYNNASTTHVTLQVISTDGVLGTGDTLPAPADVSGASIATLTALNLACHQDRYLYVLVGTSDPDAQVAVYDSDLSVTRALSTIGTPSGSVVQITAAEVSATLPTMRVVYESTASVTYKHLCYGAQVRFNGTVIGHGILARGMGLASEAWTHEGHAFVALTYDSGSALGQWQTQVILVDTATGLGACPQVGRTLRGSSAGLIGSPRLPSMMKLADGRWAFCSTHRTRGLVTRAGQSPYSPRAVARVTIDGSDERPRAVQLGQQALWAGGSPTGYDGGSVFEQGFPIAPEPLTADYGAIRLQITERAKLSNPQTVRLTPPADDVPGNTGLVAPKLSGAKVYPGEYVIIFDSDLSGAGYTPQALVVWYTVDGSGSAPSSFPTASAGVAGFRLVQVDLLSTDSQRDVCRKIANAVNTGSVTNPVPGIAGALGDDSSTVPADQVTYWIDLTTAGVLSPIEAPLSSELFGWQRTYTGDNTHANRVRLTCPAGRWISSGQWFQLSSSYKDSTSTPTITDNTTVLFYFTVDGVAPSTVPSSPTAYASAPIAILSTDTAYQVAGKVATAVAGYQRSSKSLWATTQTGPCVDTACIVSAGTYAGTYGALAQLQVRNNNVGGGVRPGKYVYWAAYEWTDAQGQYHISQPSLPFQPVVASLDDTSDSPQFTQTSVKLTVTTLRLTLKGQVQIGLFRTEINGKTGRRIATLANDSTVDTLTFLDTFADTDIQAAEPIYTAGGEVDHNPPQSCDVLTSWQGRMVLGSLDDPNSVAYSLPQAQGYGLAFSDLFTLRTDGVGGRITALAVLDERLVIFKASRIFVVSGELPNVQGVGGSVLTPQLLAADVGCISPESVVLTPSGLLFQSAKGIYLLDRSFSVQYLGAPVERALGSRRITGAVMLPDVAQVRMTTADGDALVLDYLPGELAWGTWTGHQAQHAALWQGRFVHLRSNGRVMREEPGVYTDDGKPFQARARTAWLHMEGLVQGFQRVYRLLLLGTFKGAHKLIFKAFYDYQDVDQAQLVYDARVLAGHVFGSSSPYGAGSPFGDVAESRTYQVRAHLPRQKCEAVSFEIVIDAPGIEGAQVSQLQLELGVKAGAYKLPANRTV